MEYRRLIKFGNSSYVISVPKAWIGKNNLNKGDVIYFEENGNNELVISAKEKQPILKESEITINVEGKPLATIEREIINAYINNHDVIRLVGNLGANKDKILKRVLRLMSLEIMEDKNDMIVVKDFLNIKDVSLENVIRRMDTILRIMLTEWAESIRIDNYDELARLDTDINKLRFLVYRVSKKCMKDHNTLISIGIDNCSELLDYWLLAFQLESIGDECRRIQRLIRNTKFKKYERDELERFFKEVRDNYFKIMEAYYKGDVILAHEISSKRAYYLEEFNKIFEKSDNKVTATIIEKLRGMITYIRDIARIIVRKENAT